MSASAYPDTRLLIDGEWADAASRQTIDVLDPATGERIGKVAHAGIAEANRLPFGLAGYAFTRSIKTAHRLSTRLELGMLWINQPATPSVEMPFGGVKDSGYGSEGGPEALEPYLVTKSVSILGV